MGVFLNELEMTTGTALLLGVSTMPAKLRDRFPPPGTLLPIVDHMPPRGSIEIVKSRSYSFNPIKNRILGESQLRACDSVSPLLKSNPHANGAGPDPGGDQFYCAHPVVMCRLGAQ
jgi:hypothetical protein